MSSLRKILAALTGLLAVAAITLLYLLAPIGSGYSAKYLCSQLFVSGRSAAEQVIREEIDPTHPMFRLVWNRVDLKQKTVRSVTAFVFSPTTAVYREGFGCTLATGLSRSDLLAQTDGWQKAQPVTEESEWPLGHGARIAALVQQAQVNRAEKNEAALQEAAQRLGLRLDQDALQAVLEKAFTEPQHGRRQTQGVAIAYKGRLIAERYAPGFHAKTPILGWSMSKTVTAALAGILAQDGQLGLDDPASVGEWNEHPEKSKITHRHLLQMSSGLKFSEVYAPFGDAPEMLYANADMAAYAAGRPLAHPPGQVWYYSSGDTNLMARILRERVGGTAARAQAFARQRLFDPLQMESAIFEPDASGTFVGSSYMYASARDWARFALLLQQDGVWQGQRLLPPGWVAFMRSPVPDSGGQYGAQTWLNAGRDNPEVEEGRRFQRLPANAFYFSGYNGQNVFILPDQELIVVRLGVTHERANWSIEDFVVDVMQALGLPAN